MKYDARHLSESEFTIERIRARQRGEYGDEHRDRDLEKKRFAREIASQRDQKREVRLAFGSPTPPTVTVVEHKVGKRAPDSIRGIPFLSNR